MKTDADIDTLYHLAYQILEKYPEARDCNFALFHYFYKVHYGITDTEVLKNLAIELPKSNSVERAARRVQADGYFTPSRFVENYRSAKELRMRRDYGGSGHHGPRANYRDKSWKKLSVISWRELKKIESQWREEFENGKETDESTFSTNNELPTERNRLPSLRVTKTRRHKSVVDRRTSSVL